MYQRNRTKGGRASLIRIHLAVSLPDNQQKEPTTMLNRRQFFRLTAGVAALAAFPRFDFADSIKSSGEPTKPSVVPGFDRYTESYAAFCATPAAQRTFYALRGQKIVAEKLDNKTWKPAGGGGPNPALPIPGGSFNSVPARSPFPNLNGQGPYQPTWDSFQQYSCPEWYQDAKFGIWNHWSPQCVPENGDWYARSMYIEKSKDHRFNIEHYGPPSRFGYKDLCAQWTLLNWEPGELMDRYKKAGAKLFLALANHHDGFDTWDSKHHEWNAKGIGPHRDVVGEYAAEARQRGMHFGVTAHAARNWWWFQTSHGADTKGPLAGVPYDGDLTKADGNGQWWQGLDPQQLYAPKHPANALPDVSYVKTFYDRIRDLIDQHNPDLLYFDDTLLPLGWAGMNIGAYFYNHNLQTHNNTMQAILNIKGVPEHLQKCVVADIERGIAGDIRPNPWQSETCIGNWHYQRSLYEAPGEFGRYLHPRNVIHWMIDAVSKNGTFILNIPGKPDGTIDSKEQLILDHIGQWMGVNSEAIYATRPWKIFGEGPHSAKGGSFRGAAATKNLDASNIRFTRNKANTIIYAIVLGWPQHNFNIKSLGTSADAKPGKIAHVELLGCPEKLNWHQTASSLQVDLPAHYRPALDYAVALKIHLA